MNAARLLVLIVAAGIGMPRALAQPNAEPTRVVKASDSLREPGGLRPPNIPGKENAALLYFQAWDAIDLSVFEQVHKSFDGKRLLPAQARVLKSNQKFVEAVIQAAATPECDWGPDFGAGPNALLPHLSHLRGTARTLGADARRCVQEGDIHGAAKRVVAIVQMSQQVRTDRVLISSLVGAAINQHARNIAKTMMDEHALTPEAGHMIMAAIKAMPDDPFGFKACMTTERELGLEWARQNCTGPDAGVQLCRTFAGEAAGSPELAALEKLGEEELRAKLDQAERYYDELDKLWCKEGKDKEFSALEARLAKGEFGLVAMVMAPSISKANGSYLKSRAGCEALVKELAEYIRDWKPEAKTDEGSPTP